MKEILIATHNKGKLREILEVLAGLSSHTFLSLADVGITEDVEETGVTHEENAILKARFYQEKTGLPTNAEDSGIYVDAFPGDFGVYTRRWKGLAGASDEQWINAFLQEIITIPVEKRTARFICCAAYLPVSASSSSPEKSAASPSGSGPLIVTGETRGTITHKLLAPLIPGIPISSCFIPDGYKQVYAALTIEEKNKVSHRGKAMHQLRALLENPA